MKLEQLLQQIAKENHTTPQIVRKQMEEAMLMGQQSKDPIVQARWAAIPKQGDTLTLEEFLDYMVNTVQKRMR